MESVEGTNTSAARSGLLVRRVGAIGAASTVVGGSAFALLAALASPASASTITVSEATDDGTGGTANSLSWAIKEANLNPGPDVIEFSVPVVKFTGSASQVLITDNLIIRGAGASSLTIDFDSHCGLESKLPDNAMLTVSGMTLKNGSATSGSSNCGAGRNGRNAQGGAFLLYGWYVNTTSSVTFSGVTFDNNSASMDGGALACGGKVAVTIENSMFSSNSSPKKGGGAYLRCSESATITGSVFTGNTALYGAGALLGVSMAKTTNITNSSITGNHLPNGARSGAGGGLYLQSGVTTILNSTISGNSAFYGGGIMGQVPVTITQSTITGNTATKKGGGVMTKQGILNDGRRNRISLVMSTVSGNTSNTGAGNELMITRIGTTDASLKSSIVGSIVAGSASGNAIDGWLNPSTNFPVDISNSLLGTVHDTNVVDGGGNTTGVTDPKLGALADNGGPTKTMKLLAGSPALDAGPATVPTFPDNAFDQRGTGFDRVRGAKVDIGAFEDQSAPAPTTTTPSPTTTAPSPTTTTPSSSTTTTISPTTSTTIDVSPKGPATPVGGVPLELPAGEAAQIDVDGIVTELPITQTGPQSIEFGLQTIGADLGGTKVNDGTRLDLTVGGNGTGDGFGFQAGSTASVWILSDPHQLGTATVKPDGTFDIPFVVPADLDAGGHTVQLQGIGYDGQPRALLAGVTVSASGSALPYTGRDLTMPVAIGGGLLAAGAAGVFASRRTRPAAARSND